MIFPNSTAMLGVDGESSAPSEPTAEYLLVCQARSTSLTEGSWSFTLETAEGGAVLDADDFDAGDLNRLTLLAAVRGLESIDGPSSVMLLSNNRYLIRSLTESLPRWRENDFVWEHFGRRIDVQHGDLWRRIDRALQIHRVEACLISSRLVSGGNAVTRPDDQSGGWLRVDSPHVATPTPRMNTAPKDGLRRWLLAGGASQSSKLPQRRFKTRDWLESA